MNVTTQFQCVSLEQIHVYSATDGEPSRADAAGTASCRACAHAGIDVVIRDVNWLSLRPNAFRLDY